MNLYELHTNKELLIGYNEFGHSKKTIMKSANYYRNKNGKLHRLDGPAVIYNNDEDWDIWKEYYINGKLGRIGGGPAITKADYDTEINEYYENDKLHRLDGPAHTEHWNGGRHSSYWIDGIEYSVDEYAKKTGMNINELI